MNAGTEPNNATDRAADHVESPRERERVGVVIGSTRPTRICPGIAEWIRDIAQEQSALGYELIDLAEVDLPFLDEPLKGPSGNTSISTRAPGAG